MPPLNTIKNARGQFSREPIVELVIRDNSGAVAFDDEVRVKQSGDWRWLRSEVVNVEHCRLG